MAKVDPLNDVTNLGNQTSSQNTINNNNDKIEDAFDNTLSRDGSSPNQMEADLDMNSRRITNLPAPVNSTEPLRKDDQFTTDEAQQFATDAEAAKDAAETALSDTEDVLAEFKGIYLGAYSSDPSTDPNGDPINEGDFYWDTVNDVVKFYNGSSFVVSESNSFFPNVDANVTATEDELNTLDGVTTGNGVALTAPTSGTDPGLGFGVYRTPRTSGTAGTLVVVNTVVSADDVSSAIVDLGIDESGGASFDYSLTICRKDSDGSASSFSETTGTVYVPPGASYVILNIGNPNGSNSIQEHREFFL